MWAEKSKRWACQDGLKCLLDRPPLALGAVKLSSWLEVNDGNRQAMRPLPIQPYNTPILSFWDANRLFLAIEVSRLLR